MATDKFQLFERSFAPEGRHGAPRTRRFEPEDTREFMEVFGGSTCLGGIYRVHNEDSGAGADQLVAQRFERLGQDLRCFGFDWLGRQFALGHSPNLVLLLEPGTGEALEIPFGFRDFHSGLHEFAEAALAKSFFEEWKGRSGVENVGFSECVGYRIPLFLGGADIVENLELSDTSVYWHLMNELAVGSDGLAEGTRIDGVIIDGDSSTDLD